MIKNSKTKNIWLSALVLFVCVVLTTLAFTEMLHAFLPNDSGAIALMPEKVSETAELDIEYVGVPAPNSSGANQGNAGTSGFVSNPGFMVYDKEATWGKNTGIDIFKISYENGQKVVTVQSDDGEKVIAPGTNGSYTFKLKNTGNVAIDYRMEIDAYTTPSDVQVPLKARISRYDSRWIIGSKETYVGVAELDAAEDIKTLGAGKFTYYTLDWKWPFEGNDELDTLLGSMSAEEDVTFTIVIKTYAVESGNPYDTSGISSPKTGDGSNMMLWTALAVGSFALMIFVFFNRDEEERRKRAEEKDS